MSPNNELFYSRLPINEIPLSDLLTEEHLFCPVPANWYVLLTDIKGSTQAIERGLHETVNLLATGSIVAVLNLAQKANFSIPFFFGGDGATFLLPASLLEKALQALQAHRENTLRNFDLTLRVGFIPVSSVYEAGHKLTISKLRANRLFIIPVSLGDGLSYAEKIIKGEDYVLSPLPAKSGELDLTGMQCRWDKIKTPQQYDEVVSLLVIARDEKRQAPVFKKVIDLLDGIYGNLDKRQPITLSRLKFTLRKLGLEMRTRFGGLKGSYFVSNGIKGILARWYFQTKKGLSYLDQLIAMSDTLVIDGKINTVISGSSQQRESLETALRELEAAGEIRYGLYVSKESVMSCYVRNLNEGHIHFVDGSEGGYTRAAAILKAKFTAAMAGTGTAK